MNGIISKLIIAITTLLLVALAGCQPPAPDGDAIYFVHSDHLNVPTVVTDKDKTVVWEGHRKPFGETEVSVATIEQPFRFPGQYYDSETGLHYNLMRDYDSRLGRYVQSDPIGLEGGVSTYGYAGQNPIMAYDPSGEFYWVLFPVVAGASLEATINLVGMIAIIIAYNEIKGDNVIPFPGTRTNTGDATADPDCPDECELERAKLIKDEISIRNDMSSGPPRFGPNAGNQIEWQRKIRARQQDWNNRVTDYNRRCPKKIPRRF